MAFCPLCGNQMIDIQQPDQEYCSFCRKYISVKSRYPTQPQAYQRPAAQPQYQQPVEPRTYQQPMVQQYQQPPTQPQTYQQPAYYQPKPAPSPRTERKKNILTLIVVIVAVIICLASIYVIIRESDEDKLIGSWSTTVEGIEFIWTFERGGSGTVELMGEELPFTWSINEGRKELTLTVSGSTTVLDYRFINDNTLELSEGGVNPIRFTRV